MNHLFQIKVCGITSPDDAEIVCRCGADAIGLNFYAASSRFVETQLAVEIAKSIDEYVLAEGRQVSKVGVFVNLPIDEVVTIARACQLDFVQFHGDESPSTVGELRSILGSSQSQLSERSHPGVIRAVRTGAANGAGEPDTQADTESAFEKVNQEISHWIGAGAEAILLDAAAPGLYGGTGNVVDWSVVPTLVCDVPLILAGGLTPDNVAEAIQVSGVSIVDTASGVESSPGVKDPGLVVAFVDNARFGLNL